MILTPMETNSIVDFSIKTDSTSSLFLFHTVLDETERDRSSEVVGICSWEIEMGPSSKEDLINFEN